MTDPYSVLGITPVPMMKRLKKPTARSAKQYHPDLHPR